jgi:membrane protein implicated in regulation of membrane protease activity
MDWDVFWSVMLVMFVWIPLMVIWAFALIDLFARRDLSGWKKAAWLLAIIFLPILGTLFYYLFRPVEYVATASSTSSSTSSFERISTLQELRQGGVITDEQYERGVAHLRGA